jgi:hypothetical protein
MSVNFLPSDPTSPVLDQLPIEESNPTNVTISDTTGHQTLVGGAGQNEISTLVGNDTIYSGFGGSLINTVASCVSRIGYAMEQNKNS